MTQRLKLRALLFQLAAMVYPAERESAYEFGRGIGLDTLTPFV